MHSLLSLDALAGGSDTQDAYHAGNAFGWLYRGNKQAALNYPLSGRLYLAKSGWLLLSVPNALIRGVYDAMTAPGAELPAAGLLNVPNVPPELLNAHISVMTGDEVKKVGADNINERGHTFGYSLGAMVEITPKNVDGISKIWALQVSSPALSTLRKSYGLSPLLNDNHAFHITVAVRRKKVLQHNEVSKFDGASGRGELKAAEAADLPWRDRVEIFTKHPRTGKIYGGVWDNDKSFAAPGGGIDPGETPEQAAVRELAEETGIQAANPVLLPIPPVKNPWSDEYRARTGRNFAGSRTHFVLAEFINKQKNKNLDFWAANNRRFYSPEQALALMQNKTLPSVGEARMQALQHILDNARKKSASAAEKQPSNALSRSGQKDLLPGGEADNLPDREFSPSALAEGAHHEHEHTDNAQIAKEIAKDHLSEDPRYYEKVRKIAGAEKAGAGPAQPVPWNGPEWVETQYRDPAKYKYFPNDEATNMPEAGGRVVNLETGVIAQAHIPDRAAWLKSMMQPRPQAPKQPAPNPAAAAGTTQNPKPVPAPPPPHDNSMQDAIDAGMFADPAAAQKELEITKKFQQKTSSGKPNIIDELLLAKRHSDNKRYGHKTQILRRLMEQSPQDWVIDDSAPQFPGITHTPTKFQFHTDRTAIPAGVKAASAYGTAFRNVVFNPRGPLAYDHTQPVFENIQNQLAEIKRRGDFMLQAQRNNQTYRAAIDPNYRHQLALQAFRGTMPQPALSDQMIETYGDGMLGAMAHMGRR